MNENEIERRLQQAPLAKPPDVLNQRMHALFNEAWIVRSNPFLRPVPVWLAVAACFGFAAIGFGVRPLVVRRQPLPTVVVVVPSNETLARLLTGQPPPRSDGIDFSRARIQVITQPSQTPEKL